MKLSWICACSRFSRSTSSGRSGRNGSSMLLSSPAVCTRRSMPCRAMKLLEAERGRDHPDRADDAVRVEMDAVGRRGQPVAARGRHVLDEGVHRHPLLVGQPADARRDQARLRRAAAGRVDRQRHRLRLAAAEGRLDQRRQAGVGQRRRRRSARPPPITPSSRRTVTRSRAPEEVERIFHRPDVGQRRQAARKAGRAA